MGSATLIPGVVPQFPVELSPPDLHPWLAGNTGVPGVTTVRGPEPGPHVVLLGLLHGNEIAGAIVLDRIMREQFRPARGTLTIIFANLSAFDRFDPEQPTASRFIDEDLNRVWDPAVLDGPRGSSELDRARALRPMIDQADLLLDLHSMLWPSDPLLLCGPGQAGRALGLSLGVPDLVVADHGHATGPRLIDYPRFTGSGKAAACLVEAGQHWRQETVAVMQDCVAAMLGLAGMAAMPTPRARPRCAEVTLAVTASTSGFTFLQPYRGGDVIPERNTLIALDGGLEIRTPHDDTLLIMPSLRASRGHTAVRMARFLESRS
ncbi:MAG: succinylglutamate desuccinylase/aspartoacylase family protein [Acetobacteraceae bacterium]|nr:succinylglutamate desuccinylase/aspartoacylase family protein [Acetobacteraceae bacterium]